MFSNSLETVLNSSNALGKTVDIKKEPSLRDKANRKPINEITDVLRASLYFSNQREIVKFCNRLLDGRISFPNAEIIEYDGRRLFRPVGDNPYRGAVHLLLLLKSFNTYIVAEVQLMLDKREEKAKIHSLYKIQNAPVNNPNYVRNRMDREFGKMLGEKKPKYYLDSNYKNRDRYYSDINENTQEITKGELEEAKKKKDDRCTRIAKSKYDVWPSAYASGAVVKCRQGKIWKGLSEEEEESLDNYPKELIKKAHDAITRRKGKDYAPDVHELQAWIDKNQEFLDEKTDFSKEKSKGLHGWFERQGGKGKSKGWVDCNTCRTVDGKKKCKTCGRQEGEKRSKYPACRPTPSACSTKGKGKSWGKKSEDVLFEQSKQEIERELKLNEIKSLFQRHIGKL